MSLLDRFDFLSPEMANDPYPAYAVLRDEAPLFWDVPRRAFILSRHEDVVFALKNHGLFSSERVRVGDMPINVVASGDPSVAYLLNSDPPHHSRLRARVSPAFTPKRIAALEPRVRECSRQLVSELTAHPRFEVMQGLASPLPLRIIGELLGSEPARYPDLKRWSDLIVSAAAQPQLQSEPAFIQGSIELHTYMSQLADERRRAPREDLVSLLVQEGGGTAALSPKEVTAFAALLMMAGNETTTFLMGNALLALARHPEQYEWLRRNPSACAAVCEEALRYDAPVLALPRRTTADVELSGGRVPEGSMVMLLVGSANRDPRRFPDPDRFDVQRDTQGLVAFGHGIHFCLGASLARLEVVQALHRLLEHAPRLSLASGASEPPLVYEPSFFIRGPKRLWLQAS